MLLWLPALALTWFAVGLLVAVPFLLVGVGRAVEGAAKSSWAFRLMVLPAAATLWPVVLRLWLAAPSAGDRRQ